MTDYQHPSTGAMTIYPAKPYLREDIIKSLLEQANSNAEVINRLMRENLHLERRVDDLSRRLTNASH